MEPLGTAKLLEVWDHGQALPAVQRALILLAAACPDATPQALADLSIGQRDARLLTLREWMFGRHVIGTGACPSCGERLEMTFDVSDIRILPESDNLIEPFMLNIDGVECHFRLPSSADLVGISGNEDLALARRQVLERCLLSPQPPVSDAVLEAIAESMAHLDPQADMQLALNCPMCSHTWDAVFDIVSFFWSEISAWASRILREVHVLASAYGWSQSDILAMSARRRQIYLHMVGV